MTRLALFGGKPVRTEPYPPWPQGDSGDMDCLHRVISGSRWFSGPRGDDPEALGTLFGNRFASLHGTRFGLPVANGSVAIEIALRALGIQPGDEVIVPAYTFVSTATSVLMVGGIPIFADIDPGNYCLDAQSVKQRIGSGTRAVIAVHLGGHMADMPVIQKLAEENELFVIEDSAQAIDAGLNNRKSGSWGHFGTFSFQSNKTVTAGEGGLVMTDHQDLSERAVAFRAFGRFPQGSEERSSAFPATLLSSNYRLSELQAALLLSQLQKYPQQDDHRQSNARYLTDALQQVTGVTHVRKAHLNMKHGYYYYIIRYDPGHFGQLDPERLCRAMNAEGIPLVPGDREPIYRHPVFNVENLRQFLCPQILEQYQRRMDSLRPECPHAEAVCRSTLILRHQVLLADRQGMDHIIEALNKIQKNIDQLIQGGP